MACAWRDSSFIKEFHVRITTLILAKMIFCLLTKRLQIQNADNDDDEQEQTHDMASRFRNRASLFVLATWTLGNHVAPEQEVVKATLMMMMTTETHLIALIGKNLLLPVSLLMFM